MVTRNNKNVKPEPAPRTGGDGTTPAVSLRPGDGENDQGRVVIPLGRDDHQGNRPERNVALEGDKMQRRVGGGEVREHEYADDSTPPDAEENRDKR